MKKDTSHKDDDLIKNIKEKKCSKSLTKLVDKHSGICFSIGKKYLNTCDLSIEDLNDNRYWIIYNAANSFDPNKGSKFSTWLGNQIRFFCLNYKNKNFRFKATEDSILEFLINKENQKNDKKEDIINNITDLFNQISDSNTKNAIYYRYFYNKDRILNYSEIAKILDVTPQTVLNWHNKFIDFAKKKLTKNKIKYNI